LAALPIDSSRAAGTKQGAWSFGPFFLGVVAISVILIAMLNSSRGSLIIAVPFDAQINDRHGLTRSHLARTCSS
jgi:hypothetical protein